MNLGIPTGKGWTTTPQNPAAVLFFSQAMNRGNKQNKTKKNAAALARWASILPRPGRCRRGSPHLAGAEVSVGRLLQQRALALPGPRHRDLRGGGGGGGSVKGGGGGGGGVLTESQGSQGVLKSRGCCAIFGWAVEAPPSFGKNLWFDPRFGWRFSFLELVLKRFGAVLKGNHKANPHPRPKKQEANGCKFVCVELAPVLWLV